MLRKLAMEGGERFSCLFLQARYTLDRFDGEVVAVEFVEDGHVEGCRRRAFLDEAADMDVAVVGALIGQAVDEVGIAVIGEDDRLVRGGR